MNKMTMPKKSLFISVCLLVVVLSGMILHQQQQIARYKNDSNQVNTLLRGEQKVFGFACGVLSESVAISLLNSNVTLSYGQGPTRALPNNEKVDKDKLYWQDSCRYEDPTNSSKYIEMYVSTFQSSYQASQSLYNFLRSVNDVKELPADGYGSQLLYDGGAYYLLDGHKIVQVSASNGSPQELESFSRSVFVKLIGQ
jgi:hypothetical protein